MDLSSVRPSSPRMQAVSDSGRTRHPFSPGLPSAVAGGREGARSIGPWAQSLACAPRAPARATVPQPPEKKPGAGASCASTSLDLLGVYWQVSVRPGEIETSGPLLIERWGKEKLEGNKMFLFKLPGMFAQPVPTPDHPPLVRTQCGCVPGVPHVWFRVLGLQVAPGK